jgi:hypothetical protein
LDDLIGVVLAVDPEHSHINPDNRTAQPALTEPIPTRPSGSGR